MNATTTFKFRARHRPSPNSSLRIFAEKELELFFFFSGMKLHQESDGVDLDGDGVHPGDDHTHAWPAALGRDGPDFLARRDCNWQDSQNMYCCGVEWAYFTLSAQRGLHFRFGTRRPEKRQLPMAFASAGTTYRLTSKQMVGNSCIWHAGGFIKAGSCRGHHAGAWQWSSSQGGASNYSGRSVAFVSWCLCVLTFVNVNRIVPALFFDNKARPQDKLVSPHVLYVVRPE